MHVPRYDDHLLQNLIDHGDAESTQSKKIQPSRQDVLAASFRGLGFSVLSMSPWLKRRSQSTNDW